MQTKKTCNCKPVWDLIAKVALLDKSLGNALEDEFATFECSWVDHAYEYHTDHDSELVEEEKEGEEPTRPVAVFRKMTFQGEDGPQFLGIFSSRKVAYDWISKGYDPDGKYFGPPDGKLYDYYDQNLELPIASAGNMV